MKPQIPLTIAAALCPAVPGIATAQSAPTQDAVTKPTLVDTKAALRDLWIGHIFWVRNVVDARFDKDANKAKAAEEHVIADALAGGIAKQFPEKFD